jgi:predicted phage-related endonuclease
MIERHTIDLETDAGRAKWLALRKSDVTASTVGALFGCHPYESQLGLFKEKTGLETPLSNSAMLEWRLMLEGAVAVAVARQRPGWKIIKATEYLRDPDLRIGATPDFYIEGDPRGLGVLQAKTIAPSAYKKQWQDGQPPFWIALQNATELMLEYEADFGAVAGLVIDPWKCQCEITEIPRHAGVETRIRDAVAKFWLDVEAGREPAPDYAKDAELIASMYPEAKPLKTIDLTGNNMLPVILPERATLKAQISKAEARVKEIDTEIKFAMADAEIATLGDFTITNKTTHRKGFEVKPTSFRALRISDNRPKGTDDDDDSKPF